MPTRAPSGSNTGPWLTASVPESTTCTRSGFHENGALAPSKYGFHPAATAVRPRSSVRPRNTASSATNVANAAWSRSAIVFANASSRARTFAASASVSAALAAPAPANAAETSAALMAAFRIACLMPSPPAIVSGRGGRVSQPFFRPRAAAASEPVTIPAATVNATQNTSWGTSASAAYAVQNGICCTCGASA